VTFKHFRIQLISSLRLGPHLCVRMQSGPSEGVSNSVDDRAVITRREKSKGLEVQCSKYVFASIYLGLVYYIALSLYLTR
jgi:hypothetical protein